MKNKTKKNINSSRIYKTRLLEEYNELFTI